MKKLYPRVVFTTMSLSIIFCQSTLSQIKVFDNGYVGVTYTTSTPLSKLVVGSQGVTGYQVSFYKPASTVTGGALHCYSGTGNSSYNTILGIYSISTVGTADYFVGVKGLAYSSTVYSTGRSYGLYGQAGNATSGYNYGVYGYLSGSNNGAGVFGTTNGDCSISGKYAGYFYGNVKVTSEMWATTVTQSDARLKDNIESMKPDQSIENVMSMNPVSYNLKQREFKGSNNANAADSTSAKAMYDTNSQFFKKTKYGFLAQEIQKIYPDLVYQDEEGNLGIDYTGLIPVLISAMQEQQQKIEKLETELQSLKKSSGN
jgi:hypothetical protein